MSANSAFGFGNTKIKLVKILKKINFSKNQSFQVV